MPRLELNFLKSTPPTDDELLMQLVYGLAKNLQDAREENCPVFVSFEGIPNPEIRRLMKLLIQRCGLPLPLERVDQFVEWRQTNHCWTVSKEMCQEVDAMEALTPTAP